MIIILKKQATKEDADKLLGIIKEQGLKPLYMPGSERTVLGALGDERVLAGLQLDAYTFVDRVVPILSPYKLASRDLQASDTVVKVGDAVIGPGHFNIMAGPCAVESEEQIVTVARAIKAAGGHILRGGAFKPRTSPYSFQGLEKEGLKLLQIASRETGLPVVTEIIDIYDVEMMSDYVDMFQVGARNMQNFRLLRELGRAGKPVLLKRGMSASYNDFLMSAEYILNEGNPDVVLCERGIKTFVTSTRNTLDLNIIPWVRQHTHLPIIVDPSHGTGIRDLVLPMAKASVACGADGVMIEVHPQPDKALSDGPQSLYPDQFAKLVEQIARYSDLEGRSL
ncbi:MAG: 3-deoxy-7-phosphoheptulonate synthase [bacterium]|nr:3-deoxy-7-phosphoheptulonate synthase [bacterium]